METQLNGQPANGQPDLQRLLKRESEIQHAMRRPGGIRITVERELHAIREQLKKFSAAARSPSADSAGGAGPRTPHAAQP
jgi:hypothetical protein